MLNILPCSHLAFFVPPDIFSLMKNNSTLDSLRRVCKQKTEMFNYFRILKALTILFLLFVCMNYVPNQNVKVLEEILACFNSDHVKTTLKRLRYFKMALPLL